MILFWVSVPVLSVQRTSIAPKFWMALSRFTIVLRRAIVTAPLARFVVTIIGSISGVNPTATDTANSNDCSQSPFSMPLIRNTNGVITIRKRINIQLTLLMPLSKLVSGLAPMISFAIAPKQVASPVAATTATAAPLTTLVPMKQAVSRSKTFWERSTPACLLGGTAYFSSGIDSPVSIAWLTNRSLVAINLTSAGTMSPAER